MLDKVERGNNMRPDLDPSRSFKFGVEEKILCSSGKVSYNKRDDCILSLNIPLQEATNKGIYLVLPSLFRFILTFGIFLNSVVFCFAKCLVIKMN